MWLLRAKDARLEYFVSPEHVPKDRWGRSGYAILSHVWGKNEQTFQDIQALPSKCAPNQTPRDIASEKIREACELAEEWGGYEWIWIDTCCIDKSSSTELSEAINSMFRYYSLAGLCLAYLDDVSSYDGSMPEDEFKKSKWHSRGWTLQELIAPTLVVFVSSSWKIIGAKRRHAELVEEATGVPVEVLEDPKQMKKYSIAQRMSWAARRVTTREEDEAYCLLGIFDINMSTLYGEGRKAFRRLQEEIMRQSPDTTLFAWGLHCTWDELVNLRAEDPAEDPDYHLFATSPSSFHRCSQLHFVDPTKCLNQSPSDADKHDGYITFASTPHGVSTVIPTLEYQKQLLGHLGWVVNRRFLLLLLQPLPSENNLSKDILYRVGGIPLQSMAYRVGDSVSLGRLEATNAFPNLVYAPTEVNARMLKQSASTTWRRVYLADEHVITTMKTTDTSKVFDSGLPAPEHVHQLPYYPFHIDPRHVEASACLNFGRILPSNPTDVPWTGDPPITLGFYRKDCGQFFLRLGVCTRYDLPLAGFERGEHWAYMVRDWWYVYDSVEAGHDCSKDHISNWPDRSRKHGFEEWNRGNFQFTLSFTPLERLERTLVLHLRAEKVNAFANDCEIIQEYRSHLQSGKTEETEGRQGHPSSDIVPTQAGTAVQSHDLVASDSADTERPQNGTSGGDSARSPTENESRIKTGKRVMDGLRARWKSGWSRVLATRRWPRHQNQTTPERDTAEQGGVAAEVVEGTTDVRP